MYEAFYGLNGKPFNLTPDPRFLYLSQKHKEAFAHLVYGIKNRSGFVMVSGEIGTGKTTICRSLLNQLDEDTELAFIFNPYLSQEELLRKINEEFGIETRARSVKGLIDELNEYLLRKASEGKNCVLVIDEAQNLEVKLLEQIRLLSNLETETQKLLQIILIGQPELAEKLALPELRQLNQRITARYHLKGLDFEETMQYIAFRLRVAGGRRKVKFSRAAVRAVYVLAKGTPRVINALCDRALLIGYTRETHTITAPVVRQAAREIQGENFGNTRRWPLGWVKSRAGIGGLVAAALFIGVALSPVIPGFGGEGSLARDLWGGISPGSSMAGRNLASATVEPETELASAARPDGVTEVSPESDMRLEDRGEGLAEPVMEESAGNMEGSLDGVWLDEMDVGAAWTNALTALLLSWNMAVLHEFPGDNSDESIVAFARENGFALERLRPTPEQLYTINLPALVRLDGEGERIWAALLGAEGDEVRLSAEGGKSRAVARTAFESRYAGEAAIFWLDPAPQTQALVPWSRGERVTAFQEILITLELLEGEATGVYDRPTIEAVRRIQEAAGLRVDGIAGQQTRMVLTNWLNDGPAPRLASESFPVHIRKRITGADVDGAMAENRSVGSVPRERGDGARGAVVSGRERETESSAGRAMTFEPIPLPDWERLATVQQAGGAGVFDEDVAGGGRVEEVSAVEERSVTAPAPAAFVIVPSQASVRGEDAAQ